LESNGIGIPACTIVDATIFEATGSMKNCVGRRDLEIRQTEEGNKRYFGFRRKSG
jgi:hypothetical protein